MPQPGPKPTWEPCHATVNGRELKSMTTEGHRLVGIRHDGSLLSGDGHHRTAIPRHQSIVFREGSHQRALSGHERRNEPSFSALCENEQDMMRRTSATRAHLLRLGTGIKVKNLQSLAGGRSARPSSLSAVLAAHRSRDRSVHGFSSRSSKSAPSSVMKPQRMFGSYPHKSVIGSKKRSTTQ